MGCPTLEGAYPGQPTQNDRSRQGGKGAATDPWGTALMGRVSAPNARGVSSGSVQPAVPFDLTLCPMLPPSLLPHVLIPNKHPRIRLCLGGCFWKTQPGTQSE